MKAFISGKLVPINWIRNVAHTSLGVYVNSEEPDQTFVFCSDGWRHSDDCSDDYSRNDHLATDDGRPCDAAGRPKQ